MTKKCDELTALLEREVKPALGCTGPTAYALATASCRPFLTAPADRLEMALSPELFKTGFGVATPGSPKPGIAIAAANGLFGGDCRLGMEVLQTATERTSVEAEAFIAENRIQILCDWSQKGIYAKATVYTQNETVEAVLEGAYDHISSVSVDGREVCRNDWAGSEAAENPELSIAHILEFARTVEPEKIRFLEKGMEMNYALALAGLRAPFGHEAGRALLRQTREDFREEFFENPQEVLPADACKRAKILVAAAADARMGGCSLPAMCTMEDGNQGITAINPVYAASQVWKIDPEKTIRAVALSHLSSLYVKTNVGRTSPFCMCGIGSASGVAAALTYLRGGNDRQIEASIINLLSPMMGMLCDGAKPGCAFKMCIATEAAFTASATALQGISLGFFDGTADESVAKTIQNISKIVHASDVALSASLVNIIVQKTTESQA